MAFRIEAAALAIVTVMPIAAQEYPVKGGLLRLDSGSIAFVAAGKHQERSHEWKLDNIRQLTLGATVLKIQTYEHRTFVFGALPKEAAAKWYPIFSSERDQRFVAALADDSEPADWRIPVHLRKGVEGDLLVSRSRVVFRATGQKTLRGADPENESRTWRISDIESVASADRFELTVTTREKEFRFDLKQALPEEHYRELWRRVNRAQGLELLND